MSQACQRRGDGRGDGGDGAPPLPDGGGGGGSNDRGGGGGGGAVEGEAAGGSLPVRLARQCWGHLVVLYVWLAAGGCTAAAEGEAVAGGTLCLLEGSSLRRQGGGRMLRRVALPLCPCFSVHEAPHSLPCLSLTLFPSRGCVTAWGANVAHPAAPGLPSTVFPAPLAPHTCATPARATAVAAAASRKYRYDLHTALYMLDPWERALFNTVLLVILAWSARLAAGSLFGAGAPAASQ